MEQLNYRGQRGMMRRLRAGLPVESDSVVEVPADGAQNVDQLRAALQLAIEDATESENSVLVFRVRHESFESPDSVNFFQFAPLHPALRERLDSVSNEIQVLGSAAGQVIGFIPELRRRTDGDELIAAITGALTKPVNIDGLPTLLGPHTGGAILGNDNATTEQLFQASKLALAETDASRVAVMFHPYQRVRDTRATELQEDFRQALVNRELTVAYQPVINLRTGAITGIKAYPLWERQGKGTVSSAEVAEIAEQASLVAPVGQHVLGESFAAVAGWVRVGLLESTTLWLQVHPLEVLNPGFSPGVTQAVQFDPRVRLGIELTTNPIENQSYTHGAIRSLVAQGARASLGDLGKGSLDLADAQKMPFTEARIDSSLTRPIAASESAVDVVKLLINLSTVLGLETTVEGIDTAEQLSIVQAAGANWGQGNHFTAPLLASEMIQLLREVQAGRRLV